MNCSANCSSCNEIIYLFVNLFISYLTECFNSAPAHKDLMSLRSLILFIQSRPPGPEMLKPVFSGYSDTLPENLSATLSKKSQFSQSFATKFIILQRTPDNFISLPRLP